VSDGIEHGIGPARNRVRFLDAARKDAADVILENDAVRFQELREDEILSDGILVDVAFQILGGMDRQEGAEEHLIGEVQLRCLYEAFPQIDEIRFEEHEDAGALQEVSVRS